MLATILITDDSMIMRMQLKRILDELGHEVIGEAENGKISIEKYKVLRPQLVIMDITMPEMGGIDAVREIKKIDPNSKIIMCSAMGQQEMVFEAVKAGAIDFIVKPFDTLRIKQSLQKFFN